MRYFFTYISPQKGFQLGSTETLEEVERIMNQCISNGIKFLGYMPINLKPQEESNV